MILYFAAFLAMVAGGFFLLNVKPSELLADWKTAVLWFRAHRRLTLKQQIKRNTRQRKPRGIRKILLDARAVLVMTHRMDRMPTYTTASIILFFVGFLLSVLLRNYFCMPILAVGLSLIPWLAIIATAAIFKRRLNGELETTLGMITTSYIRTDSFLVAVQENLSEMQHPVKDVFEKFLVQANLISSDIPGLLQEMKDGIDNATFQDWVDQVIQCQDNRALKSTLQPIVDRFSDVREVSGELNNLLYEPLKEYITLAIMTIMNYPVFYAISKDWYNALMYTTSGQILVALTFVVLFFSLIGEIRNTRPIEYVR